MHPQDSRVTYQEKHANGITARYGTGGGNTPIVLRIDDANGRKKNGQRKAK